MAPWLSHVRSESELVVAAEAGGDEARAVAERLTATLDSATRLAMLNVLTVAADEITRDLAPGSVEIRLRGVDPSFVVTTPPSEQSFDGDVETALVAPPAVSVVATGGEDGGTSRINLRLPDHLKARVEEAAGREGLSVNAWLVRAAAAVLEPAERSRLDRPTTRGGQQFTGWVR